MSVLASLVRNRRRAGIAALVCVGLAFATMIQTFSWNQTAHYALIRSVAHGTPMIDRYVDQTGDKARFRGHWYSSRAPGLALFSTPAYGFLTAVDAPALARAMPAERNADEMMWMLGLWGAVLPGLVLLLLVRWVGDRFQPGYGTAAAVTVGLGTLILPLSTLLFSHVLGACLAFAAFALLLAERSRPPGLRWVAAAGGLAGLGMTVEYPVLFAAAALGIYAIARPALKRADRLRRAAAYVVGAAAGLVPLAAYNLWAFGSIGHVAYADLPRHQSGFFGIRLPSLDTAATLLLSSRGLLILAPVLVLAIVGTAILFRTGRRAEALVIAFVAIAYVAYDAGYFEPFGGATPGPRFLTTMVPFLGPPLAIAYRRLPALTLGLAASSATVYVLATLTHPLVGYERETVVWTRLAADGSFQPTIATAVGLGRGFVAPVPFLVLAALAVALAVKATPPLRAGGRSIAVAAGAVGAWALAAAFVPAALGIDSSASRIAVAAGVPPRPHSGWPVHPLAHVAVAAAAASLAALAWLAFNSRRHGGEPDTTRTRLSFLDLPLAPRGGAKDPDRQPGSAGIASSSSD